MNTDKLPETEEEIESFIAAVDSGAIQLPQPPPPRLMVKLVRQHDQIKRLSEAVRCAKNRMETIRETDKSGLALDADIELLRRALDPQNASVMARPDGSPIT